MSYLRIRVSAVHWCLGPLPSRVISWFARNPFERRPYEVPVYE
jgi:hypothetical protein